MKWPSFVWLSDKFKKQGGVPFKPFFGYEQVSEDEKTRRVVKHFNSVARRYDFMNTLLSFGIHYLWKREAVNLLKIKSSARVIDVCGGTGDCAIHKASGRSAFARAGMADFCVSPANARDKICRLCSTERD